MAFGKEQQTLPLIVSANYTLYVRHGRRPDAAPTRRLQFGLWKRATPVIVSADFFSLCAARAPPRRSAFEHVARDFVELHATPILRARAVFPRGFVACVRRSLQVTTASCFASRALYSTNAMETQLLQRRGANVWARSLQVRAVWWRS